MRYLIHYPRSFCNEYTIFVGSKETLDKLAGILDRRPGSENADTHFITRRAAIRKGISRVNEAKRDGEQWFGGFAESGLKYNETLDEILTDAAKATLNEVTMTEDSADWYAA